MSKALEGYSSGINYIGDLEVVFYGIVTQGDDGKFFIEKFDDILWDAINHSNSSNLIIADYLEECRDEVEKAIVENYIDAKLEEQYERMQENYDCREQSAAEFRDRQEAFKKLK